MRRPLPNAALALRHAIPTLLSPLSSTANAPPDDFQSNAWADRRSLAGLGIACLRDAATTAPPVLQDSALRMQLDGDDGLLSLPAETHDELPPDDLAAQTVPYRDFASTAVCVRQPASRMDLGFDSDIDPTASDIIGLIPDVNMYDKRRHPDLPHPGVNPLDTIYSASLHDIGMSYGDPASPTPEDHHMDDILSATDSRAEQSPSPRVIQDIMSILVQPAPGFWSAANPPSTQRCSSSQPAVSRYSATKLEPTNVLDGDHRPLPAPCKYLDTTHLSPVLNAHLGIELSELIFRAERFRTKYPERAIDRTWLSHFAGKLSDRGELLNDFRCYVIGCDQRNKRRDHILVHVGAHIGQRPFACSVCPLRFLRKNECKRHEASHSGFRPYSCDICGQSFVRQDLVKRHAKRTHGLRDENQSGVGKQSRKKARLQ